MRDALRMDTEQVLIIRSPCDAPFVTGLQALPGVKSVACSGSQLLVADYDAHFIRPDQSLMTFKVVTAELGLFGVYGVAPIAGELPERVTVFPRTSSGYVGSAPFVINETAARMMGFTTPSSAAGRTISTQAFGGPIEANRILAVVPDFSMGSVEQAIPPTAYVVDPFRFSLINVKLGPGDLAGTLEAINQLWRTTGAQTPIDHFFADDHIERLYLSLLREAQAFSVFSAVAVVLACVGLLALSVSMARSRTREFGVRKAMGAETRDIARLLIWQFVRPVVLANLIAWPVAGVIMTRWLQGFAYHVYVDPWLFVSAGGIALLVALLTVSGQSIRVARGSAASALRYP
jgi:putative ABC transport system permease protein